jgi:hypothetical protein
MQTHSWNSAAKLGPCLDRDSNLWLQSQMITAILSAEIQSVWFTWTTGQQVTCVMGHVFCPDTSRRAATPRSLEADKIKQAAAVRSVGWIGTVLRLQAAAQQSSSSAEKRIRGAVPSLPPTSSLRGAYLAQLYFVFQELVEQQRIQA